MNITRVPVDELAYQIRGVSYTKDDVSTVPLPGYLPVLRAGNIADEGLVFDDLVFVPAECISANQKVRRNDVVIAASSGSLDVVGKAARAIHDYEGGFGAFCKVLRPGPNVDPSYFGHFFRTAQYRRRIAALAAGLNINNLRNEHLDRLEIPMPPIAEQRRIAVILDKADALRAARRAAHAQLGTVAHSIFMDMFGDPTAPDSNWPFLRIGDVAEVQGGLQVSAARKVHVREVPYLRVANVHRGYLDLTEIKNIRASDAEIARTTLRNEDLLIVEGHGNPAEIGRAALWDGSIPGCIHQNHLIRVRFDSQSIDPVYACTYLNSPFGRRHLLRAGKTTSGLNTINVSEVRATPIPKPPFSLQAQFADRIQKIDAIKASSLTAIRELDALFAALQHRAFRGEL